jgi:competence protein ComEC
MALTLVSLAFLGGIFLTSMVGLMPPVAFATAALLALVPFLKRHRMVAIAAFCLIALAAGAVRFEFAKPYEVAIEIASFNDGGPTAIRGIVYQEPEMSGRTLRLYIKTTEKSNGREWYEISGNVLVFLPEYADYSYGDVLEFTGKPETPVTFADFDYRAYLAERQIYTTMLYPKVTVIEKGKGSVVLSALYAFKRNIGASLSGSLPEPQAALAKGILLGTRGGIPSSVKDDFAMSGTTHILAISGANLSIIAAMLLGLFTRLFGKRHGVYVFLTLAVIWGYSVLTGLEPPVVRSAVMASVFLAAELLGRQKSALPALAFSGAVMTLIDPPVLWDVSFQLSFMAMAGLVLIYPAFELIGRRLAVRLFGDMGIVSGIAVSITDNLGMSLAAAIALFPLTVNYFGTFTFAGLPATVLVLPVLPAIIFTTALTGLAGLALPPLATVFGYAAWLPLSWLLLVIKTAASIPNAQIVVPALNAGIVITYYAALLLILSVTRRRLENFKKDAVKVNTLLFNTPLKWFLFPATLAVIVAVVVIQSRPDGRLHVSFLDVGQGDAVFIQQGTRQILVDGGPDAQTTLNALGEKMLFWDRNIELIVLTHPDADHITGLIEVIKRYNVDKVLYPDADFTSQASAAWLTAVNEKGIAQFGAMPGQRMEFENITVEVIMPKIPPDDASVDAKSISLRVSEGNISFLLTADITSATERELILERAALACTVLKVAHHGSIYGTSAEFLAVSDPEIAVISVGKDDKFGHPAPEVLARLEDKIGGANIYRTDENGTVEFITDGEKLWVVKEK